MKRTIGDKIYNFTAKQYLFCLKYVEFLNAHRAALEAGYSPKTARFIGAQNLTKINIKALIEKLFNDAQMSADEALKLLSDIARGDIADIMDESGLYIDMKKAKETGKTKLIHKIKRKTTKFSSRDPQGEDREVEDLGIEIYAADKALKNILRVHGRFVDRTDITSDGEKVETIVHVYMPDNKRKK